MSVDRWMNEQDVVYINNGVLCSYKNEQNHAVCKNMDWYRGYYAKWISEVKKEKHCMVLFICESEYQTK